MAIRQALSSIKRSPASLWTRYVGKMHSRNSIQVVGDSVYVSSSGRIWDRPDDLDGVSCIDVRTGELKWFFNSAADANELFVGDDVIIFGSDTGDLYAIERLSGRVVSQSKAKEAIYCQAVPIYVGNEALAISISANGDVISYKFQSESFEHIGSLPYRFRANPAIVPTWKGEGSFLAAAETGEVLKISVKDGGISYHQIFKLSAHLTNYHDHRFDLEIVSLSNLVVSGDQVLVSYARSTSDPRPPLSCFSLSSGEKLWDGGRVKTVSKKDHDFGNSRVRPVLWRDQVLSTFSYNSDLHSFSLATGRWLWKMTLDEGYFQNWSSPVISGDTLYVARINGVVSKINLKSKKVINSSSVDTVDIRKYRNESNFDWDGPWPEYDRKLGLPGPGPDQPVTAGICATPGVSEDRIVVGTVSGDLLCLPS